MVRSAEFQPIDINLIVCKITIIDKKIRSALPNCYKGVNSLNLRTGRIHESIIRKDRCHIRSQIAVSMV